MKFVVSMLKNVNDSRSIGLELVISINPCKPKKEIEQNLFESNWIDTIECWKFSDVQDQFIPK